MLDEAFTEEEEEEEEDDDSGAWEYEVLEPPVELTTSPSEAESAEDRLLLLLLLLMLLPMLPLSAAAAKACMGLGEVKLVGGDESEEAELYEDGEIHSELERLDMILLGELVGWIS